VHGDPRRGGKTIVNWLAVLIIGAGTAGVWLGSFPTAARPAPWRQCTRSAAVHYIETHAVPARGFDSYNWGGFLIWKWYPDRLVFVDGRPDMYGDSFMDQYVRAYDGTSSWRSLFAANRLCYALVEPDSGICGRAAP